MQELEPDSVMATICVRTTNCDTLFHNYVLKHLLLVNERMLGSYQ